MLAAFISFLFGGFEALMLKKLLFYFTSGNYKKTVIFFIIKVIAYGIGISLLILFFKDKIYYCALGYCIGLPLSVIIWFLYNLIRDNSGSSGDDGNENNNNS